MEIKRSVLGLGAGNGKGKRACPVSLQANCPFCAAVVTEAAPCSHFLCISNDMFFIFKGQEEPNVLHNPQEFMLAGKATFTILNSETQKRFTFRVRKPSDETPHFVSVLSGANNEKDYRFLGTIFEGAVYQHGRKSSIKTSAQSAKVFTWLWERLQNGGLPAQVQVFHEGTCGRCGRKLTVPKSIEDGFGPECINLI